jgi:glycosyl transferase family 25
VRPELHSDFPPVFVISLVDAADRRKRMTETLGKMGLGFSFLDAVDGRRFNVAEQPIYNGPQRRLFFGRDLMGGEIGVLMSHRAALQRIVDDGLARALVLEDDVIFADGFTDVIQALVQHPDAWELVRFLGDAKHARRKQRRILPLGGGHWLTRLPTSPGEAHAYLINRAGAAKLLRRLKRTSTPIDTLMGQPWKTGIGVLSVYPGVAWQDTALGTSISDVRFDKKPTTKGLERMALPVAKTLLRLSENLLKRVFYYGAWWRDRGRGSADPST